MEKRIRAPFDSVDVRLLADILSDGGIAVIPTDTIYGLHCTFSRQKTLQRLIKLKGRGRGRGMILLASNMEMVDSLVSHWPNDSRARLAVIWPAPLTAILPASKKLKPLIAPNGKVAVRIPAFKWLADLIELIDEPLVSTSANISGTSPLTRIREIEKSFPSLEAYISRRGRGSKRVSTIVDFTSGGNIIVRRGAHRFIDFHSKF